MAERKNDINWFPGHMRKALNETGERLKLEFLFRAGIRNLIR